MNYTDTYRQWLNSPAITADERDELRGLDEGERKARFFAPLSFGTAGLRGVMGPGLHRMNVYVVRQTTQALANLIVKEGPAACRAGVIIGYDCRRDSDTFAKEAACVLAANGVSVRLFSKLCPTPQVSFAIRHYGAAAGINITASHNPKEYNGYKVYWRDGAQLPPPHADAMAAEMDRLDIFTGAKSMNYNEAKGRGLITLLGDETDDAFLACVLAQRVNPQPPKRQLDIVYTPFHGTGYALVPRVLREAGYTGVSVVAAQAVPDGTFPTVKSPNPEYLEGFTLAIEQAQISGADVIVGTDPDADRVGVVVKNADGEYTALSGNQTGVLLTDYLIRAKREAGTLADNACVITTIVSTLMTDAVAAKQGVDLFRTFTGFKFIAEKMEEKQDVNSLLIGFEESYGYMIGDFCRDKDAVTATLLIVEMAHWYAEQGLTLSDAMEQLFKTYGRYTEKTINQIMPGLDGLEKMRALMDRLRREPLKELAGTPVIAAVDYLSGTETTADGTISTMELSGSDVLAFKLKDGVTVLVRPSGTEPKIKIYILSPHDDIGKYIAAVDGWQ